MNLDLPGTVLSGRYRLIGAIGQGATGSVYKALDLVLNRVVAIKALSSLAGWPRHALMREARAAATLHHPNILRVFDFFESGGSAFIVMELIEGRSLADILREGKPLDRDYAIAIAAEVGSALAYAHHQRMVHRDVKPSNIFISSAGRVVLLDFGLAIEAGATTLTSSGTVWGTPAYMSPEQAMGLPLDSRSDVYSLGLVVYESLSGQPWISRASDVSAIIERVVTTPVEPIRRRNPDISEAIERVLAKALAREPADRFQTADEFVRALRDAAALESSDGMARGRVAEVKAPPQSSPFATDYHLSRPGPSAFLRSASNPGYLLVGYLTALVIAAQFPARWAWAVAIGLVCCVTAAYFFYIRAAATGGPARGATGGEPDEPPETTESPAYTPPPQEHGRTVRPSASLDPLTAESPAYMPLGVPATLGFRDPTAGSWLLVLSGPHQGRQYSLGRRVVIGRSAGNTVVLDHDAAVSRTHAEIALRNSRFHVRDLSSRSGTLVNGVNVHDRELRDRDEIQVGATTLLFISAADPQESGVDSRRRLVEFSAIWNDLTEVAHEDE